MAGLAAPKYEWEIEDRGLSKERVSVAWGDAKATTGKTKLTPQEAKKQGLSPQETIGFLVKKTDKVVGVASERDGEGGGFRQVTFIPRKTVSKIRRMEMAHGFKEPYEDGKSGEMELERTVIREADNGGFIVKMEYRAKRKNGELSPGGYEETEKVYESWDKVADLLEDIYGDGEDS